MDAIYHRKTFFDEIRPEPFHGRVSASQVSAIEVLLDYWETNYADKDIRWLAYILATNYHETGGRMVSVREGFAKSDTAARKIVSRYKYGAPDPATGFVYYGRGRVQLTWADNYKTMGEILGLPLYENPDLALDDLTSVEIMVEGMLLGKSGRGDFTGKALSDYFNASADDPVGARKIVNGSDRALKIAGYYEEFLRSLKAAKDVADKERAHVASVRRKAQQIATAGAPNKAAETLTTAESISAKVMRQKPQPTKPALSKDRITIGTVLGSLGAVTPFLSKIGEILDNPWALLGLALVLGAGLLILTGRIKIAKEWGI